MKTISSFEELLDDINYIKKSSYEEMFLITYYSLISFFKSLGTFGTRSSVTKDNLDIIKEVFKILRYERKLLNFILYNIKNIDIASAMDVVTKLDELNDKTIWHYYEVIEDIETAISLEDEQRGKRAKGDFPTLIKDDTYTKEVVSLVEDYESIKKFLGFEEEFWNFSKDKIKVISDYDDTTLFKVEPLLNEDEEVKDFLITIPNVTNLETALITIKLLEEGYEIYKNMGKKLSNRKSFDKRDEFVKKYLPNKINKEIH